MICKVSLDAASDIIFFNFVSISRRSIPGKLLSKAKARWTYWRTGSGQSRFGLALLDAPFAGAANEVDGGGSACVGRAKPKVLLADTAVKAPFAAKVEGKRMISGPVSGKIEERANSCSRHNNYKEG